MADRARPFSQRAALFASIAAVLALPTGCGDDQGGGQDTDNGTATGGSNTSQGPVKPTEPTAGPTSGSTTVNSTDTDPTAGVTGPDTGGEEEDDGVVIRTGEFIGDGEVGRISAWGITDEYDVNVEVTWVQDGEVLGDALVRWQEYGDVLEVLASPGDLFDSLGTSDISAVFDATGAIAYENEFGCVGMWNDVLDPKICASEPELAPGGFVSLEGLANGTALVSVRRNSPDNPRFEFYGVSNRGPRVRYALSGDAVNNVAWQEIDFARNGLIMPSGGVLMQVAGSTPEGRAADGLLTSQAEGTAEAVTHLYSEGAQGYTGVFPGGPTFPPALVPNNGVVYRGFNTSDQGRVVFTYTPTEPDGTLADNAGIYSVVPGQPAFTLHHRFSDGLSIDSGLSQIDVQGTTPASPAIAFGLTSDRRLVMSARLRNGDAGIFQENSRGEIQDVATTGAWVPDGQGILMEGATYADIGSLVMAADGSLMYTARIEGPGIEAPFGLGVWGMGPNFTESEPRMLAKLGDPLPSEDGAEVLEIRIAGLVLPDQTGIMGLGQNRSIESSFNFSGFGLQAWGTAGSSQAIPASGACPKGLVLLSDGDTDVLIREHLNQDCIFEDR